MRLKLSAGRQPDVMQLTLFPESGSVPFCDDNESEDVTNVEVMIAEKLDTRIGFQKYDKTSHGLSRGLIHGWRVNDVIGYSCLGI